MYGLTRGAVTLIAAGVAGLLVWVAAQIDTSTTGGYWGAYGVIAGAGLVMALSQLLGGWTKWGWPHVSLNVFLLAFVPALIVGGWVILAAQPNPNWFRTHVLAWSGDISVDGVVADLGRYASVIAFGLGLILGFTFDTSGPRVVRTSRVATVDEPADGGLPPQDEPVGAERMAVAAAPSRQTRYAETREEGAAVPVGGPAPEPPPRAGDPPPPS
jgi:hypothetical protein